MKFHLIHLKLILIYILLYLFVVFSPLIKDRQTWQRQEEQTARQGIDDIYRIKMSHNPDGLFIGEHMGRGGKGE